MILDGSTLLDTLSLLVYSNNDDTQRLARDVMQLTRNNNVASDLFSDPFCSLLVDIIQEVLEHDLDPTNDAEFGSLMLKMEVHPKAKENPYLLKHLKSLLEQRKTISARRIQALCTKLKQTLRVIHGTSNLRNLFSLSSKWASASDDDTRNNIYLDLVEQSNNLGGCFQNDESESKTINTIDMGDKLSISKGLELFQNKRAQAGYKPGLQAEARQMGRHGGYIPGMFYGYAACSHHYKTGMLMRMTRCLAMYNVPRTKSGKQSALVFISCEDEIYENLMDWFREAYYNHKKMAPPADMTDQEIVDFLFGLYNMKGFRLIVLREDGDGGFTFEDLLDRLEKLEKKYEILALILDYMAKMGLPHCEGPTSKAYELLASKIKNWCQRRSVILATGLQLNGEADVLAASGQRNIVRRFTNAHLADAKGIKKELDALIFTHIETDLTGRRWLTSWIDKLKKSPMPEHKDRYWAVPFTPFGIVDDLFDQDSSCDDIYNVVQTKKEDDGLAF